MRGTEPLCAKLLEQGRRSRLSQKTEVAVCRIIARWCCVVSLWAWGRGRSRLPRLCLWAGLGYEIVQWKWGMGSYVRRKKSLEIDI